MSGTSTSHAYVALRLANFYPGGDVAIGAIERHTVRILVPSLRNRSFAKIAPMLSRRRAGLIGATVMIVR